MRLRVSLAIAERPDRRLGPNLPDRRGPLPCDTPAAKQSARLVGRRLAVPVRLLVLGGTAWLGRAIAEDAAARGHEVTCLARGTSGGAPVNVRFLRADRDSSHAYDDASHEQWDAVVDVARQPGQVRGAVAALAPVVGRYVFVSSANVYASQRELDQDESAALLPPLASDVMESMDRYGEAKVACEQAITAQFGPHLDRAGWAHRWSRRPVRPLRVLAVAVRAAVESCRCGARAGCAGRADRDDRCAGYRGLVGFQRGKR